MKKLWVYPKRTISRLLTWHAKGRKTGSHAIRNVAVGYLSGYNNIDFDMETNGEVALISRAFDTSPDIIFDVGANVGIWSLRALHHHATAQIHAFEIAPAVFEMLKNRVKSTGIIVNNFGLSDSEGTIEIKYYPNRNELSSLHSDATRFPWAFEIVESRVLTGSDYCKQNNITHIDFLKIDTEGHEISVLRGFCNLIEEAKISVIQFEHNEMAIYSRTFLRDFYQLLGEKYVIGRLLPFGVDFKEYSISEENFLHANYVAVARSKPEIVQRLKVTV